MAKEILKKQTSRAFGKTIYLLGKDENGTKYWLEAPSWDCGWYWGFGYVESYTNNSCPDRSHDIGSHQHIKGRFLGKQDNGEYIYNIYDSHVLDGGTTFNEKEGWELSELFKQFYTLKEAAELFHRGHANVTNNVAVKHDMEKCNDAATYINETMIPAITKRVVDILSGSTL